MSKRQDPFVSANEFQDICKAGTVLVLFMVEWPPWLEVSSGGFCKGLGEAQILSIENHQNRNSVTSNSKVKDARGFVYLLLLIPTVSAHCFPPQQLGQCPRTLVATNRISSGYPGSQTYLIY
jgi:hypothetical protein